MSPPAPGAGVLPGGWACHLACTIVAWGSLPPGVFWTCTCDTSSPALLWWWMWSPPGPPWHFVLRVVGSPVFQGDPSTPLAGAPCYLRQPLLTSWPGLPDGERGDHQISPLLLRTGLVLPHLPSLEYGKTGVGG